MEPRDKKKAVVVAVLFGFLAVYWGYQLFFKHEKQPVRPAATAEAGKRQPPKAGGKEGEPSLTTPIKVDLSLLKGRGEAYKAGKNIFNPVYRKPVLVKPGQKGAPGTITVAPLPPPPPPPPPRSAEEIAADNAKEELNKVKVLGFLKRKSRTDVFLSLGNDTYIAAKGDTITQGYYLKEVGKDFVVVADRDTNTEVRLNTTFEKAKGSVTTVPSPGIGGEGVKPGGAQPAPPMGSPGMPGPAGPGARHNNPLPETTPGRGIGLPVGPSSTPSTPGTYTVPQVAPGTSNTTPSTPGTYTTTTSQNISGTADTGIYTAPSPLTGHSL